MKSLAMEKDLTCTYKLTTAFKTSLMTCVAGASSESETIKS